MLIFIYPSQCSPSLAEHSSDENEECPLTSNQEPQDSSADNLMEIPGTREGTHNVKWWYTLSKL